jgi:hypothetical protein
MPVGLINLLLSQHTAPPHSATVDVLHAGTDSPRFAQGLGQGLVPRAIRTETTEKWISPSLVPLFPSPLKKVASKSARLLV